MPDSSVDFLFSATSKESSRGNHRGAYRSGAGSSAARLRKRILADAKEAHGPDRFASNFRAAPSRQRSGPDRVGARNVRPNAPRLRGEHRLIGSVAAGPRVPADHRPHDPAPACDKTPRPDDQPEAGDRIASPRNKCARNRSGRALERPSLIESGEMKSPSPGGTSKTGRTGWGWSTRCRQSRPFRVTSARAAGRRVSVDATRN